MSVVVIRPGAVVDTARLSGRAMYLVCYEAVGVPDHCGWRGCEFHQHTRGDWCSARPSACLTCQHSQVVEATFSTPLL